MSVFGRNVTKESLVQTLRDLELDWGDAEDALDLVEILLTRFTPAEAMSWLLFHCDDLKAAPVYVLGKGRAPKVFACARNLVQAATPTS